MRSTLCTHSPVASNLFFRLDVAFPAAPRMPSCTLRSDFRSSSHPPSQPDLSCTHHATSTFLTSNCTCLPASSVTTLPVSLHACVVCGLKCMDEGTNTKLTPRRVGSGERTVDMKRIKVQVSITAPLSLSLFRAICAGFGNGRGRLLRVSEVLVSSSRRRQGSPASVPRCTAIRRQRDANDHQAQITRVPSCESRRPQCETSASSRLT